MLMVEQYLSSHKVVMGSHVSSSRDVYPNVKGTQKIHTISSPKVVITQVSLVSDVSETQQDTGGNSAFLFKVNFHPCEFLTDCFEYHIKVEPLDDGKLPSFEVVVKKLCTLPQVVKRVLNHNSSNTDNLFDHVKVYVHPSSHNHQEVEVKSVAELIPHINALLTRRST